MEINGDVFLRVSCMEPDVNISMLCDSDISEVTNIWKTLHCEHIDVNNGKICMKMKLN